MENHLDEISGSLKDIQSSVGFIMFAASILVGLLFAIGMKEKISITDYSKVCQEPGVSVEDCKKWDLFKITYYTNRYTQQVMFEGINGPVPFEKCDVVNRKNWLCHFDPGYMGYKDGKFIDKLREDQYATVHFGKLKYWWYSLFLNK